MKPFEKINLNQIVVFSDSLADTSLLHLDFIQSKYKGNALNFAQTLEFMQKIGSIDISGNLIIPRPGYRALLQRIGHQQTKVQLISAYVLNQILLKHNPFSQHVNDFLSHFEYKYDQFAFKPSYSQKVEYSYLRNLLIDLGFLILNTKGNEYVVSDNHILNYLKTPIHNKVAPEELVIIQQKNYEIGRSAELRIVEYEKDRLSRYPDLLNKIEHVSEIDSAAGYDIRSFEGNVEDDPANNRFIEVKAVSGFDYGFNWTRNEITISKLNPKHYYLYLLPVLGKAQFDMDGLKIIKDPFKNVYSDTQLWIQSVEVYSFSFSV